MSVELAVGVVSAERQRVLAQLRQPHVAADDVAESEAVRGVGAGGVDGQGRACGEAAAVVVQKRLDGGRGPSRAADVQRQRAPSFNRHRARCIVAGQGGGRAGLQHAAGDLRAARRGVRAAHDERAAEHGNTSGEVIVAAQGKRAAAVADQFHADGARVGRGPARHIDRKL